MFNNTNKIRLNIANVFILFSLLISFQSLSQINSIGIGSRAVGMGNASITLNDVWSIHNNVAGLAEVKQTDVGVFYQNRFGMSGFNTVAFSGSYALNKGAFGVGLYRFGDQLYNEQILGFGYANKLDFVSLGVKVNMLQLTIDELGTKRALAFDFGGIVDITEELKFGAQIFNLSQAKLAEYEDERFSTVLKAGFQYAPFEKLLIILEAEKEPTYKAQTKAGIEYKIIDKLAFRTGFNTLRNMAFFGLGFQTSKLSIDYSASYHSVLGMSNQFSINYNIRKQASVN